MNDPIDRQTAIDAHYEYCNKHPNASFPVWSLKILEDLPSAQPQRKRGEWTNNNSCPFCGFEPWYERDIHSLSFCPNCGADMRNAGEIARDIMHEAIDNSVWSDIVDVEEMHRVVDDKYADMRGEQDE